MNGLVADSPRPQARHGVPNEERFGVSQVIVAGGFAYVAGQIARGRDGTPAPTRGLIEHVDRAVETLDAMLGAVGLDRAATVWVESHVVGPPETLIREHHRWFDPRRTAGIIIPVDNLYDSAYRVEITTIASEPRMSRRSIPASDPTAPFARAVRAGGHIFVSAQTGVDAGPADPVAQFDRGLERVLECVAELGGSAEDLVSTHIYTARELTAEEIGGIADVHRRRCAVVNRPTSNLIGVRRLAHPDAVIEVSGIAVIDE